MTEPKQPRTVSDLDLERRLSEAGAAAARAAEGAASKAGEFTHANKDRVEGWLDKAESEVTRITGGKGSSVAASVHAGLSAAVDAVAAQRGTEDSAGSGPSPSA